MNEIKGRQFSLGDVVVADDGQYDLLQKYLPTQEETDEVFCAYALRVTDQANSGGRQFVKVQPVNHDAMPYSKRWIPADALCLQPFETSLNKYSRASDISMESVAQALGSIFESSRASKLPTINSLFDEVLKETFKSGVVKGPGNLPVIEVHSLEELEALLDGKTPGMFIIKSSLLKDTPLDPDPEAKTRFNGCGYTCGTKGEPVGFKEPTPELKNQSLGEVFGEIVSKSKRRFIAWRNIRRANKVFRLVAKVDKIAEKMGITV